MSTPSVGLKLKPRDQESRALLTEPAMCPDQSIFKLTFSAFDCSLQL